MQPSLNDSALRQRAAKQGYILHKSRKALSVDNEGGYMIVEAARNMVVAGERFDMQPDDVARFLSG